MAPTEILAEQHFRGISQWLEPLGIRIAFLTGHQKASERRAMLEDIASGRAQLAVGTHALIQDAVSFHKLVSQLLMSSTGLAFRSAWRSVPRRPTALRLTF